MLPSDFFRRNPGSGSGAGFVLSFREDAIGIRLRDVIGPDNMTWDNMMWARIIRTASRRFRNRERSWRKSWRACRTTNRPSLPRTAIRGSPAGVVRQNPQFVWIVQLTAARGVREHAQARRPGDWR